MGNFTGWTYAAVNAIASEVANIQLAPPRPTLSVINIATALASQAQRARIGIYIAKSRLLGPHGVRKNGCDDIGGQLSL